MAEIRKYMDIQPGRLWRGLTLIWLTLALAVAAQASADAGLPFSQGRLFRIGKPGTTPSHVFGTMHSDDQRVLSLPAPVRQAFDSAETVALELDLGPAAMAASMAGMLLTDGRELRDVVGDELYAQTVEAVAGIGMPEMAIRKFKPWGVAMLLSMPPIDSGRFLDLALYQSAKAQGKTVKGLETAAEQLAVFDGLSEPDQIEILQEALANRHLFDRMFKEMTDAYLQGDLGALVRLNEKYGAGDSAAGQRLQERLLDKRNKLMVKRLIPLLGKGNIFVAIGALHLPGKNGILYLLKEHGFKVKSVH